MASHISGLSIKPFRGFEGPAGSGKTYHLMGAVEQLVQDQPLLPHQRVLALTFMHGSRRRLDAEFRGRPQLRGKAVATTIDSFAIQIWNRWRSLAVSVGANMGDFNETCDACGQLIEHDAVARWIARTYPIVIVDEAQELTPPRLRIVSALSNRSAVFVAADEFQCLDENADTGPFMEWFGTGDITTLTVVRRTNQPGLLAAGVSLRNLESPRAGAGFRIEYTFPNNVAFRIGPSVVRNQGSKAVLYAPSGAGWAARLAARLAQGLNTKTANFGPIILSAEPRTEDEIASVIAAIGQVEGVAHAQLLSRIKLLDSPPRWTQSLHAAVLGTANRLGKTQWTEGEFGDLVGRTASNHRAYSTERARGVPLLPIHQAKNRQFDHVTILWPAGVPGTSEHKARLLYNGITRAKSSCQVFVQTEALLREPPFFFRPAEVLAPAPDVGERV